MMTLPWYLNSWYFIPIAIVASILVYFFLKASSSQANKPALILGTIFILWAFWTNWEAFVPPNTINGSGITPLDFWFFPSIAAGIGLILYGLGNKKDD